MRLDLLCILRICGRSSKALQDCVRLCREACWLHNDDREYQDWNRDHKLDWVCSYHFSKHVCSLQYSSSFNKFKGSSSNTASSQGAGMPIFIRQEVVEKRDSFDSLSDMTSIKESVYGSETESKPSSPFSTLTKTSVTQTAPGQKPPGASSSHTPSTVVETTPRYPITFPTSITPSGSFLDLSASKEGPENDNKV